MGWGLRLPSQGLSGAGNTMQAAELALQLRCPGGEDAEAVASSMHSANATVIRAAIDLLQPAAADRVLEIGPGNAGFAAEIIALAPGVTYTGLDWSAAMVSAASAAHPRLIEAGQARFIQGDSARMPFADGEFGRVLAVNTLYFWQPVQAHLAEILRVLRPDGRLCLAFGDRDFMQHLPFAAHGFTLYDAPAAERELSRAGLRVVQRRQVRETAAGNHGQVVDKCFHLLCCEPAATAAGVSP